jgi:predicted MFS family arabinose efflux permease
LAVSAGELRSIRRRYHLLLALRWLPTGMFITVFVLLLRDRGLTLAEIGVGTAAQGVVMLFLELPSGGLADALGRKPVLVLASAFSLVATALLLVADTVVLLAVVSSLQGVFRALDSGPLQAWYIDRLLAIDPETDLEGGLARSDVVLCCSIGLGALLAGLVVRTGGFGMEPLVAPLVVGMGIQVLGLVAVLRLMDEVRPGRGWAAARSSVAAVPTVVRSAVGIIRGSRLLTALVVAELLWGFGMVAFETLMPPRLAEVSGGADEAASLLGPAVTVAWGLSALGAAMAPWLVRRFGSGAAACGLRIGHGVTVVAMGLAAGPAGLIVAYLATYCVHGATAPVHYGMVHRSVDSSHRATVVSANSLTAQVGGAASGILLGALADATSITTAMFAAAVVLAAAGPLYLVGHSRAGTSFEEQIPLNR